MNILTFNGSPRRNGNTSLLLQQFKQGAQDASAHFEEVITDELNLAYCRGCLKCNLMQQCVVRNDEWPHLSQQILNADVLVFATPIYFHHVTASLKKVIDRFRSFIHVQITKDGLIHTPWHVWNKQFVLILCLGSSVDDDCQPVIDLFKFITTELGDANQLTTLIGTRLAIAQQVTMTKDELTTLYPKLKLPLDWVEHDYERNQMLLTECYQLGKKCASGS